ncbi:MAG: hypothetical protein FWD82_06870 [Defluviitaleaceae bacterium]|nr:hypothetical protein [Defluviitaleaceae bacterium]
MKYDKCPKCGCDKYYTRMRVCGTSEHYQRFDGEYIDNSQLHDGIIYKDLWKYPRCANCDYKLKEEK